MQQLEEWKVSDLIEYARNPRKNDHAVDKVAAAIREFGFRVPILAKSDKTVVDGHLRLKAAKKLGLETVPVILCDDMSEAQIKAFRISVNRVAEFAEWDNELLRIEFEALREMDFDIELTGFSLDEIGELEIEEIAPEYEEDADGEVIEPPAEPKTKEGDVWILGKHRLMCGDSTSIDAVDTLMNTNKAQFGFCDPPYNLGFKYNSYDDNKSDDEYIEFSKTWFSNLQIYTDRQAVTLGTKNIDVMAMLDKPAGVACWVKKNWITSCHIAKLQQWEPIFFFGDFTKHKRTSDLFEINRKVQKDVGDNHTCPKQIELIMEIVENYSDKNDNVMDLFGGSGTTLIACEKTGRTAFLMELDPKYCDVIINRWQTLTGKEAVLESTGDKFNDL